MNTGIELAATGATVAFNLGVAKAVEAPDCSAWLVLSSVMRH